ncbi:MAG TPA: hypothetical protein VF981_17025 [Gemmatimonadaceae bacterium]
MPNVVLILLLAENHLGLNLPARERIRRRRSCHDSLGNHATPFQPGRSC